MILGWHRFLMPCGECPQMFLMAFSLSGSATACCSNHRQLAVAIIASPGNDAEVRFDRNKSLSHGQCCTTFFAFKKNLILVAEDFHFHFVQNSNSSSSNHRCVQHSQLHTWMEVCLQKGYDNLFNHFPYLFSSRSKVSLKSSLEQLPSNFIDAGRV